MKKVIVGNRKKLPLVVTLALLFILCTSAKPEEKKVFKISKAF